MVHSQGYKPALTMLVGKPNGNLTQIDVSKVKENGC